MRRVRTTHAYGSFWSWLKGGAKSSTETTVRETKKKEAELTGGTGSDRQRPQTGPNDFVPTTVSAPPPTAAADTTRWLLWGGVGIASVVGLFVVARIFAGDDETND